jgi:hypothetical protein
MFGRTLQQGIGWSVFGAEFEGEICSATRPGLLEQKDGGGYEIARVHQLGQPSCKNHFSQV